MAPAFLSRALACQLFSTRQYQKVSCVPAAQSASFSDNRRHGSVWVDRPRRQAAKGCVVVPLSPSSARVHPFILNAFDNAHLQSWLTLRGNTVGTKVHSIIGVIEEPNEPSSRPSLCAILARPRRIMQFEEVTTATG